MFLNSFTASNTHRAPSQLTTETALATTTSPVGYWRLDASEYLAAWQIGQDLAITHKPNWQSQAVQYSNS